MRIEYLNYGRVFKAFDRRRTLSEKVHDRAVCEEFWRNIADLNHTAPSKANPTGSIPHLSLLHLAFFDCRETEMDLVRNVQLAALRLRRRVQLAASIRFASSPLVGRYEFIEGNSQDPRHADQNLERHVRLRTFDS